MAGLQGSGKTTSAAKLARWFRQQGRNPLLVGADLQRPAAVEQLRTMGERVGVPVFSQPGDPVATARPGVDEARRLGRDVCIVDTAGRLAIDTEMMDQVRRISEATGARLHVPRRRRHDRPGRRHRGRVVRRHPGARRRHPHQARRRRPRRRPCRSRRWWASPSPSPPRARRSRTSTCSTPTAWPAASWAWATSSPSSRRPSRSTRRRRPRPPRPSCSKASSRSTTSSTSSSRSARWAPCRTSWG